MGRDPSKLKVVHLADELVVEVYRATRGFPVEERYGLQAQLRRAAVSVPTNIVEGCARNSERDYLHFLDVAIASASEVRYLLGFERPSRNSRDSGPGAARPQIRRFDPKCTEAVELAPDPSAEGSGTSAAGLRSAEPQAEPEAWSLRPEALATPNLSTRREGLRVACADCT